MSYDCYMRIVAETIWEAPTTVCDIGNYTSNVWPMYHEAIGPLGLRGLQGKTGAECEPVLERAIADMIDNESKYKAMNPENGWGDAIGARGYLRMILTACEEYPEAFFQVQQCLSGSV